MNKRIKNKWIKALRSGDYKQTTGQLRDDTGFCCLGVLCNLHAKAHPEIAAKETNAYEYMGVSGVLPRAVAKWAELKGGETTGDVDEQIDVRVTYRGKDTQLAVLNDTERLSFKEIARVIDRCL